MDTLTSTSCRSCGTANWSDASFCWKCLSPFRDGQSRPLNTGPAMPQQAPPIGPSSTRRWPRLRITLPRGLWGWIKLAVLVFILVAGINWFLGEQRVTLPPYIGPASQVGGTSEASAERLADEFENEVRAPADVAFYEHPDGFRFLVLASAVSADSAEDELDSFARGVRSTGGAVDLVRARTFEEELVSYACVPITAPYFGAACLWADGETVGVVIADSLTRRQVRGLVTETHAAVRD